MASSAATGKRLVIIVVDVYQCLMRVGSSWHISTKYAKNILKEREREKERFMVCYRSRYARSLNLMGSSKVQRLAVRVVSVC